MQELALRSIILSIELQLKKSPLHAYPTGILFEFCYSVYGCSLFFKRVLGISRMNLSQICFG
jgi:hypothetical protein